MINYGYVPDPMSGDGEELDAYLIGKFEPVPSSKGRIIAVMHGINDDMINSLFLKMEKNT